MNKFEEMARKLIAMADRDVEHCSGCLKIKKALGEGAQLYVCDACGVVVCSSCSEDGPQNTVLCLNCDAKLTKEVQ